MIKAFRFLVLLLLFAGCNTPQETSSKAVEKKQADLIKDKFNFITVATTSISEELKQEIFIPFYEGGKYYLTDYEGKRISRTDFEAIKIFKFAPYYLGKLEGKYYLYTFPEKKILDQSFDKPLDINNFKPGNANGYGNTLVLDHTKDQEGILLEKPYEDETSLDNTLHEAAAINKYVEEGLLTEYGRIGHNWQTFQYKEEGFVIRVNDRLEVVYENKPVYMSLENFEFQSIPKNIRPNINQLRIPTGIQPYYVMFDQNYNYSHVFTCDGKYLSSHQGFYSEFFSLYGPHRKKKFRNDFVPIGFIRDGNISYYVRLTDGFEYRK